MQIIFFENTFGGFLSAVFEVYEFALKDIRLVPGEGITGSLFGEGRKVVTDPAKAQRVWTGLKKYLSAEALHQLYCAWLSEGSDIPDRLLAYIRYAFSRRSDVSGDFSHPAVLTIAKTAKKVHREKHRMEAFVRFQRTRDQLYYAVVEPDYDVLPLIRGHFGQRYADQRWLIYDAARKYGIYYDLEKVDTVELFFEDGLKGGRSAGHVIDEQEMLYQSLWQQYFKSVNIAGRRNMKLHIRHMPLRYWKYLPEKAI